LRAAGPNFPQGILRPLSLSRLRLPRFGSRQQLGVHASKSVLYRPLFSFELLLHMQIDMHIFQVGEWSLTVSIGTRVEAHEKEIPGV
jgi:hypothetical protein